MALTVPNELPVARPIAEDISATDSVAHQDDLKSVRLYFRFAAAISALSMILIAIVVFWFSTRLFGRVWESGQTLLAISLVLIAAVLSYARAELRLRSYRVDLTPDAVVFEYGRKRSYIRHEQIQLFDTETSILLRIFRLRRCCLHSGGGTVIVSPVPARVASAIERLIYDRPALTRTDRTDARI